MIVIDGYYGTGNVGDDALLASSSAILAKHLHYDKLTSSGVSSPYVERLIKEWEDIGHQDSLVEKIKKKHSINMIIYGGGTRFFDFGESYRIKWKKLKSDPFFYIKNIKNILINKVSKSKEKNLIYGLGLGIGPYVKGSQKKLRHKQAVLDMKKIAVRDNDSFSICKKWRDDCILGADLCYANPFYEWAREKKRDEKRGKKHIAFILREWIYSGGEAYTVEIKKAIKELISKGYEVNLLIFQEKDKFWIEWGKKQNLNLKVWSPETMTIEEWLLEISSYNLIVSSRYHGGVFASLVNTKCILIPIDRKLEILSEQIPSMPSLHMPVECHELINMIEDQLSLSTSNDIHSQHVDELHYRAEKMLKKIFE